MKVSLLPEGRNVMSTGYLDHHGSFKDRFVYQRNFWQ